MTATGGGFSIYVYGRMRGIPKSRFAAIMASKGSELVTSPKRAKSVALAHSSASRVLAERSLLASIPKQIELISENELRRRLNLLPPVPDAARSLRADDVIRAAKLDEVVLRWLVLYDVLEPGHDRYSYADMLVCREVSRLVADGFKLNLIVAAAHRLAAAGHRLSDTRLTEDASGEMLQQFRGQIGRLSGQFTLPLVQDEAPEIEEVFTLAEQCETEGNLPEAERWYGRAAKMDLTDPVIPFNLGNVLDEQGRRHEAVLAYHAALARDPMFPEAWYNLARVAESSGEAEQAIRYFREALTVWPKYPDALFALGRLLVDRCEYESAAPLWESYAAISPSAKDSALAKRYVSLCKLETSQSERAGRSGEVAN